MLYIGEVVHIDKFKFIYGGNLTHKSVISIEVRLIDDELVYLRGFDDIADTILRSDFKFVYIHGQLKTDGYVQINEIEKIEKEKIL